MTHYTDTLNATQSAPPGRTLEAPGFPAPTAPPPRRYSLQLPATRKSAHRARAAAVEQLRAWELPYEEAAHIVAELAANAVVHGRVPGRDFRLTLLASKTLLRVEMADPRGERLPVAPAETDGLSAESGRGLLLVAALAERWGVTQGPFPCKTVWAEIPLPPPPGAPAGTSG